MNTTLKKIIKIIGILFIFTGCAVPALVKKTENKLMPLHYNNSQTDSTNSFSSQWKDFYSDPNLVALIDSALKNNQELNIILQEINIANNEVRARKGRYLPYADIGGGVGIEKVGRYTRLGAVDANTDIKPEKKIPENLTDFLLITNISWQADIWKQLRNAKKSATYRYLATIEGKNFMLTHLVAEIAMSYYELMAFDNHLDILRKNIEIQQNALRVVGLQKVAGNVTELAVRRFEAEVKKNQSLQYFIQQQIIEAENRINFLVGRYPQPILRNSANFGSLTPQVMKTGIPTQLLSNRPDIRQAEQALAAAKLDVAVAKANFYPTLRISAGLGYQSFNLSNLLRTPESMLYNLAGGIVGPLVNRNEIKAFYFSANARQTQAVYHYERMLLRAYNEVVNAASNMNNLASSYDLQSQQVQALNRSVDISISLFNSARADYMEVLLTQRDALEARMELIETKMKQMNAMINLYQALGGGWQ